MRLGKVRIAHEYVVDLDNKEMVESAQDALYDDLMSMVKYNEIGHFIGIIDNCKGLSESDIPDFLREE